MFIGEFLIFLETYKCHKHYKLHFDSFQYIICKYFCNCENVNTMREKYTDLDRCITFCAASLMNCFAGSDHIAGTVNTQRISHSSISNPCCLMLSNACCLRYEIPCPNTTLAGNSFPPASAILVSRERFCKNSKIAVQFAPSQFRKYVSSKNKCMLYCFLIVF